MNSAAGEASKRDHRMNLKLLVTALFFLATCSLARADQAIQSAQQKLTEQGFYYGEINGKKDADTTAAIRRYQIRNGLPITGEIDAATQRSLGLTSKPAATPRPRSTATPGPTPPDYRAEPPPREIRRSLHRTMMPKMRTLMGRARACRGPRRAACFAGRCLKQCRPICSSA